MKDRRCRSPISQIIVGLAAAPPVIPMLANRREIDASQQRSQGRSIYAHLAGAFGHSWDLERAPLEPFRQHAFAS